VTPERTQAKRLYWMFFGRLFESDMMPPGLPQVQLIVWVVAFLAAPSMLSPILLSKKYVWVRPGQLEDVIAGDRTMALLFSLLATGLITLVIWEGIFPDKRDSRILGVLPIRLRSMVLARIAALASVYLMFVAATALPAALSFGTMGSVFGAPGGLARVAGTHLLSTAGAEAVVFFGVVLLQCTVLNTVGAAVAQRLAVVLQVLMVVALFQIQTILPVLASPGLVATAPAAAIAVSTTALLLYAASYRRLTRMALEGIGQSNSRMPPFRRLLPIIARGLPLSQPARAVLAFTVRTVARSRQHRMLLAGWVGLALALVISSFLGALARRGWGFFSTPNPVVLAAPLVLAALTMTGLRMLFAIPTEIRANWSIRTRQPVPVRHAITGAMAALIVCGVLPAIVLAFASAAMLWGVRIGAMHALFCGVLGVLLAEVLSIGLDKVPFTCTYMPGKAKIVKLWPLYLTIFSFYTASMASLETHLFRRGGFSIALTVFIVLTAIAAVIRRRRASELLDLRFEEQPADALTLVSF
jgi:hypothetical protein